MYVNEHRLVVLVLRQSERARERMKGVGVFL